MTELRDARLRQALDQAPDAGLQPPARVRDAIRGAAHGAVRPAWRRWWPASGERRTPWAAAFASVLVASLVVVLWEDREVPGARPEVRMADQPAPVSAPAPAPVPVPVPVPAAEPQAAQAPAPVAPAARPPAARAPAAKPRAAAPERAAADALEARRRESSERSETASLARQAAPAAGARAPAAPAAVGATAPSGEALAKAAPPPPPSAAQAPTLAAPPPPAPAFAPPPPPMAAPAPAAAPAAAARFAARPAPAWTQVRISAGGRSVLVPRSQADALPALVERLLAAPREPATPVAAALRLDLQAQGVLEWSEEGWRLLPQGDPQRALLLRADEATATAVRAESERLLGP